jgi:hypothetical protein
MHRSKGVGGGSYVDAMLRDMQADPDQVQMF